MNNVKLLADSTCDLPKDILEAYDISIIPLGIIMGDTVYHDGKDITPEDIYAWSDKTKQTPKTSAPNPQDAIDFIKPYVEEKRPMVFLGISVSMSATCSVLQLAAEYYDYKELYIIDSKNLSNGIGLLVMKAATMARDGESAQNIVKYIETSLRPRVRSSFLVDTLTYLARGGRCTSAVALLGNALSLKPMIVVKDGAMEVGRKYRGRSCYMNYAADLKEDLLHADPERVFLITSGCAQKIIDEVYHFLEELHVFREIIITRAGGVITCHCGPGTLGIMFAEGDAS